MAEPLFQGEDFNADMRSFFGELDNINHSLSKILKDNLNIVSSPSEEKGSRNKFNTAVSTMILNASGEEKTK